MRRRTIAFKDVFIDIYNIYLRCLYISMFVYKDARLKYVFFCISVQQTHMFSNCIDSWHLFFVAVWVCVCVCLLGPRWISNKIQVVEGSLAV